MGTVACNALCVDFSGNSQEAYDQVLQQECIPQKTLTHHTITKPIETHHTITKQIETHHTITKPIETHHEDHKSEDFETNDIMTNNKLLESSWPPSVFAEIIRKNPTAMKMNQTWIKYLHQRHNDVMEYIKQNPDAFTGLKLQHQSVLKDPPFSENTTKNIKSFMYLTNRLDFKDLFDQYINIIKFAYPTYNKMNEKVRSSLEFNAGKGRKKLAPADSFVRQESVILKSAGITSPEDTPDPLIRFFTNRESPAKFLWTGNENHSLYQQMDQNKMPFIAGASGSVSDQLLYLNIKGYSTTQQEQIVLLKGCALIQFGHHSLTEVLIAAKHWKLFDSMKSPLLYESHSQMITDFNKILLIYNLPKIDRNTINNLKINCEIIKKEKYLKSGV